MNLQSKDQAIFLKPFPKSATEDTHIPPNNSISTTENLPNIQYPSLSMQPNGSNEYCNIITKDRCVSAFDDGEQENRLRISENDRAATVNCKKEVETKKLYEKGLLRIAAFNDFKDFVSSQKEQLAQKKNSSQLVPSLSLGLRSVDLNTTPVENKSADQYNGENTPPHKEKTEADLERICWAPKKKTHADSSDSDDF